MRVSPMPSSSSWCGRPRPLRVSTPTRPMLPRSPRSVAASMVFRSPSSSPLLAFGPSHSNRSRRASTTGSGSCGRASARSKRWWRGVTTSSPMPSGRCSCGWRCSPPTSASRRRRWSCPMPSSKRATILDLLTRLVEKSLVTTVIVGRQPTGTGCSRRCGSMRSPDSMSAARSIGGTTGCSSGP